MDSSHDRGDSGDTSESPGRRTPDLPIVGYERVELPRFSRPESYEIPTFIDYKISRPKSPLDSPSMSRSKSPLESRLDSSSLALSRDSTPKSSKLDESHPSLSLTPRIHIPSMSSFGEHGEPKSDNRLIGQEENEQKASGSQVHSHQSAHSAEAASSLGNDHVRCASAIVVVSKLTTNRQPHHPYRMKTKV